MNDQSNLTPKERFLKIFPSLPMQAREEIIYVTPDQKPLNWNAIYVEVTRDTPLSKSILTYLDKIGII